MRTFLQILRDRKLRVSIGTVIIILMVFSAYIRIGLGDLVAHNATNASMIGIEMLCESGPNFKLAAERHVNMLKQYTTHMEDKYLGTILGIFHEEYTPTKGFAEALKTLEEALKEEGKDISQEECARAIWLAGEQIEQYRMKAASFQFKPRLHKYREVPAELVNDTQATLDASRTSLTRLKKDRTLQNAVFQCEDDRWTMQLLFLARAGYSNGLKKLFAEFEQLERDVLKQEQELYDELDDIQQKEFVKHIMDSEKRRLQVLGFLKVGDMGSARKLMWETIEQAYYERETVLEFTAAVGFGESEDWKRPVALKPKPHGDV